jgi:hypothetical protein
MVEFIRSKKTWSFESGQVSMVLPAEGVFGAGWKAQEKGYLRFILPCTLYPEPCAFLKQGKSHWEQKSDGFLSLLCYIHRQHTQVHDSDTDSLEQCQTSTILKFSVKV